MAWLGIGVGVTDLPVLQHTGGTPTPTPAPSFSVQPSISGTPQVGVSFVGTPGTASNTSYHTYRWLLATTSGGTYTAISGATSASYTPVSGDETKYLKFEDTATGAGGSTVATTTFAGPVAAAAVIPAPVITQTSTTGANPFTFSVAENAAYFPGYYWNAQSSDVSNFATTLSDVVQQIEPGDLSGTDDIVLTGFTTPSSGAMYTRLRVGMEDGVGGYTWGSWSNVLTDTIGAAAITNIVVEGDSITSGTPSTPNGFYSYQYDDYRTDKTIEVRAQGSRVVGALAELNDNGNSLIGNIAEDKAYGCQLITAMIGANDLPSNSATTYKGNLVDYKAQFGAVKFAYSPPMPYNPTGTPHPSYTAFTTNRTALMTTVRSPAVWGTWADYYFPMGEHPDFDDVTTAAPLFGDSVHPSTAGQTLLYNSFKPAIDAIIDGATSTSPSGSVWPSSETGFGLSDVIVRRFMVTGISRDGLATGVSVSGGGSPQVRLNGGTYGSSVGTGSGNGYRIYNGDIIDLKVNASASYSTAVSVDLTIGSETRTLSYTTAANVPATSLSTGSLLTVSSGQLSATHTYSSVTPPAVGLGIFAVTSPDAPTSVTFNGVACTLLVSKTGNGGSGIYVYAIAIASTTARTLLVNFAGARNTSAVRFDVVQNADPTPTQTLSPSQDPNNIPNWSISGVVVPAKGIELAYLGLYDGGAGAFTGSVTGTGNTQIASGYGTYTNGDAFGVTMGTRTADGTMGFSYNTYRDQPAVSVTLKALGS